MQYADTSWRLMFGRLCLLLLILPGTSFGHELPERVQIKILAQQQPQQFDLLLRIPLEALRDIDLPLHGPGYLDLPVSKRAIHDAVKVWIVDELAVFSGSTILPVSADTRVRVSLPADRSFEAYEDAVRHMNGPDLPRATELFWRQAMVDIWLRFKPESSAKGISVETNFAHLGKRTYTALEFVNQQGATFNYDYRGDSGRLPLEPGLLDVGADFAKRGLLGQFENLLQLGLLLVCLILPVPPGRSRMYLLGGLLAGETIALVISRFVADPLWLPAAAKVILAGVILIVALENILAFRHRFQYLYGLLAGLVYGLNMSFALSDSMQFAAAHRVGALLGFTLGIAAWLLVMVLVVFVLLDFVKRRLTSERILIVLLSALIAHSGLHWLRDSWDILTAYL